MPADVRVVRIPRDQLAALVEELEPRLHRPAHELKHPEEFQAGFRALHRALIEKSAAVPVSGDDGGPE